MKLTGAQTLIKSLEREGVEVVFGLPGGAILPVYDPIIDSSIRHILVRHEQGAGHAAEGYAQVTGRPGVAIVTSGPGATNIVTALADAYMDSVPIVVITGQVATTSIGTDAFQEVDTTGITASVTKHNWLITDANDIARVVAEAFYVATTGRPGPVLIDFPKDVATSTIDYEEPTYLDLPGYHVAGEPTNEEVAGALALLSEAKQPVLYVGGGVVKANASRELARFVELTGIPVVTTLMARGALPDSNALHLGMPGMHGNFAAVTALQHADLLVSFGARFDDRVTGRIEDFAKRAKVIHVDIDRAELGKVRRAEVPIAADCRLAIAAMNVQLEIAPLTPSSDRIGEWLARCQDWKARFPYTYDGAGGSAPGEIGRIKPQFVIEELRRLTPNDTILVAGVGQHQMWAAQHWGFEEPRSWVNSGGLGTMGFAVPAALGAKVGHPEKMVWAVDGDGCFQMTAQELVTASAERIPIKIAILNNAYLGMVRQWQHMFYEQRYSEVYLSADLPDYVMWAEAMGCAGIRVTDPKDVGAAIERANAINDRPVVIDFRTDSMEQVFPMVPAGASNDEILVHPSQADQPR